ncbi:MAG: hypothetical protein ACM34M_09515 [Ignavibacteria bacterium]
MDETDYTDLTDNTIYNKSIWKLITFHSNLTSSPFLTMLPV